ncbi:hypothetical protein QP518_07365 [Peptoniphilus harei]|uniref:hypothetical protein n=1 Tax=Peptoniphilaceae TaxID=1570339 RepID=UPI00254A6AF6|nr:hypothetical protein [Peptoniphilus harei]MDU4448248.1 hypothetical protein [Anaerococcus vaginalis]MDK7355565.1 hypothetical protein [Peptoniphilus harei]MDK7371229.1 hypothetical protein [Peptoniphilus harei]MDU3457938.1 hypothetical protein [Peptoniphilus harei]MDU7532339.1 hypothetical protein [Peptoniphilus harei]
MRKSISKYLFFTGIGIFIISYLLPVDIFENFTNLRPTGLTSLFICRIIGLVGLIFAIKEKSVLFGILNFLLIIIFPLAMLINSLI